LSLFNASSLSEINQIKETAKAEYDSLIASFNDDTTNKSNCGCGNSSAIIIMLSALLASAAILLRKKH
jgi:hypothetical protein